MKTAPPMNTIHLLAFCELHQLWQAVTLKPFKLEECTLHFRNPPIFINLFPAGQSHSCVLNTWKSVLKMDRFITVYLVEGYISIWLSVDAQNQKVLLPANFTSTPCIYNINKIGPPQFLLGIPNILVGFSFQSHENIELATTWYHSSLETKLTLVCVLQTMTILVPK